MPRYNNHFVISEYILNPILVNEALNRPQKVPNFVLNSNVVHSYSQYPVRAWAYVRSRLFLVTICIRPKPPQQSIVYWDFEEKQDKLRNNCLHCLNFPDLFAQSSELPGANKFVSALELKLNLC